MDARALRAFRALASTLHFGRAAAEVHVSPSALSRLVQKLENELGCRLFDRSSRHVRLTREGRVLQAESEALLDRFESLRRGLRDDAAELRGSVTLYCSVTASYSLLAELLPGFRRQHPAVEVRVHTGDEASALGRVLQGRDDMAIAARPDRLPPGLHFLELATTPLVFVAPSSRELPPGLLPRAPRRLARRSWAEIELIVPEGGLARERVDAWLSARGYTPGIYAQVAGNEAIVGMVALGCGCAVVPHLVLRSSPFLERLKIVELSPPLPPFRIGLCCNARSLSDPLVSAFLAHAAGRTALG